MSMSEFPQHQPYRHLLDVVEQVGMRPMSERGTRGFHSRLSAGNLGHHPGFRDDVAAHLRFAEQ
jgi:hypothetical protein